MAISGTIIYDGECPFCIKQIHRIQKSDKKKQFLYDIRQNKKILELYPELKPFEKLDGLRFCNKDHKAYIGSDSVHQIYSRLKPHNLIAWVYKLPVFNLFFKLIYKWIAKNRFSLAKKCETNVCKAPFKDR